MTCYATTPNGIHHSFPTSSHLSLLLNTTMPGPYGESSSIPFPRADSSFSLSTRGSANFPSVLNVHDLVYGCGLATQEQVRVTIDRLYETDAVYENPLITCTSRSVINDIHSLTRQMSEVSVPRPLAMLQTLFLRRWRRSAGPNSGDHEKGPGAGIDTTDTRWFRVMQAWSEVNDVYESESFDGHRKALLQHTIHLLFLPGIHSNGTEDVSSSSLDLISTAPLTAGYAHTFSFLPTPSGPSLSLPILPLSLPSPLHFTLPIHSELSFNEQGLITRHRDICDVKDIIALVPGVHIAQWLASRMAGRSLAAVARVGGWMFGFGANSRRDEEHVEGDRRRKSLGIGPGSQGMGLQSDAGASSHHGQGSLAASFNHHGYGYPSSSHSHHHQQHGSYGHGYGAGTHESRAAATSTDTDILDVTSSDRAERTPLADYETASRHRPQHLSLFQHYH
jgi:hypothetical protein